MLKSPKLQNIHATCDFLRQNESKMHWMWLTGKALVYMCLTLKGFCAVIHRNTSHCMCPLGLSYFLGKQGKSVKHETNTVLSSRIYGRKTTMLLAALFHMVGKKTNDNSEV